MAEQSFENKKELLTALREEFDRWERLIAGLSKEHLVARDLPVGLSIKDVIAHLGSWQQLSIARLEAALQNREPDFQLGPAGLDPDLEENLEQINAWIHEANLKKPWSEVYGDWRTGFLHCLDLGETIPERDLFDVRKHAWLHGDSLSAVLDGLWDHHRREHYEPLSKWLQEHRWISGQ